MYALLRFLDQLIDILASGDVLFSIWKNVGTLSIKQGRVSPYSCAGRNFIWTPVCNRVGEVFPLLAARPVRRFSGNFPLHCPLLCLTYFIGHTATPRLHCIVPWRIYCYQYIFAQSAKLKKSTVCAARFPTQNMVSLCNSSAQDFALAAKSVRICGGQKRIRPLCRRQKWNRPDSVTTKPKAE